MDTILQDLRYGFRMLRQSPGFTAVAVITLALGIGANTAMFSVINSVLFHSLPFQDSSRVMVLWKTMSNGTPNAFSTPAFLEIRQQGGFLEHLGAFSAVGKNLGGTELPEPMPISCRSWECNPFSAGCFPPRKTTREPEQSSSSATLSGPHVSLRERT